MIEHPVIQVTAKAVHQHQRHPAFAALGADHAQQVVEPVRFVREDGQLAELGEEGELQVRGPQVMKGYWQRPEETAKVLDRHGCYQGWCCADRYRRR